MKNISYKKYKLYVENVCLAELAEVVGTPTYVYSKAEILANYREFAQTLTKHNIKYKICYALKANSNLAVLNLLASEGAGFDIVSMGELQRVVKAGGDPGKVIFSGVGKTYAELKFALGLGIDCFNIESKSELYLLDSVAKELNMVAPISIRVNPDVDAQSHPYISTGLLENKFGINADEIIETYLLARSLRNLAIKGIDCHIGSQLTKLAPFLEALDKVLALIEKLKTYKIDVTCLDLGGGLGVQYQEENPPSISEYLEVLVAKVKNLNLELILEPGRVIVANAGVLLTNVLHTKTNGAKKFAIVDAGMNDLIRPALYGAWQNIVSVIENTTKPEEIYDIVGPVCESADFLGKGRKLRLTQGDCLAILSAGAYGFSMSSNYNSRPRAAEVMVDGDSFCIIRARETIESLYANETILVDKIVK